MGFNLGLQNTAKKGLIGFWDQASQRSWKGEPVTNVLSGVSHTRGNSNSAGLKSLPNTQKVYIPTVGKEVKSRVLNFYNAYPSNSNDCCPNLFTYGT